MGITTNNDAFFMQKALEQAYIAEKLGEVPVGCVIVKDDKIITSGHNRQIIDNNPSAHAEIIALENAGKILQNYRLIDCTLYVTLEPCVMCFGALIHARIKRLVFATSDPRTGSCGGCINLNETHCFNHQIKIKRGVLQTESAKLLKDFFKAKRN
jgi:tRNA(adenine34) deaminase